MQAVYPFDREVIPASAVVAGSVSSLEPVSKWERVQSILRGDFTPLKTSYVEFESLRFPDGRTHSIRTPETRGLNSIYQEPRKKMPKQPQQPASGAQNAQTHQSGVLGISRRTVQDRLNAQLKGQGQGIVGALRSPEKKERLYDLARPSCSIIRSTCARVHDFDAELSQDLSFGSEPFALASATLLGTQPQTDTVASSRRIGLLLGDEADFLVALSSDKAEANCWRLQRGATLIQFNQLGSPTPLFRKGAR